jgi:hypothetical protein
VLQEELTERRKDIGCFTCAMQGCGKTWYSAHAFREYQQGCKDCEKYSFPSCLWYNYQ